MDRQLFCKTYSQQCLLAMALCDTKEVAFAGVGFINIQISFLISTTFLGFAHGSLRDVAGNRILLLAAVFLFYPVIFFKKVNYQAMWKPIRFCYHLYLPSFLLQP